MPPNKNISGKYAATCSNRIESLTPGDLNIDLTQNDVHGFVLERFWMFPLILLQRSQEIRWSGRCSTSYLQVGRFTPGIPEEGVRTNRSCVFKPFRKDIRENIKQRSIASRCKSCRLQRGWRSEKRQIGQLQLFIYNLRIKNCTSCDLCNKVYLWQSKIIDKANLSIPKLHGEHERFQYSFSAGHNVKQYIKVFSFSYSLWRGNRYCSVQPRSTPHDYSNNKYGLILTAFCEDDIFVLSAKFFRKPLRLLRR